MEPQLLSVEFLGPEMTLLQIALHEAICVGWCTLRHAPNDHRSLSTCTAPMGNVYSVKKLLRKENTADLLLRETACMLICQAVVCISILNFGL